MGRKKETVPQLTLKDSLHKHKIKHDKTTMLNAFLISTKRNTFWHIHIRVAMYIDVSIHFMVKSSFILLIKQGALNIFNTNLLNTFFAKLQLPVPCRAQGVFYGGICFPAQFRIGIRWIRPYFHNVAGSASYYLVV